MPMDFNVNCNVKNSIFDSTTPILANVTNEPINFDILNDPNYPNEMETFEVELVKDQQGLGITIAGYVCEKGL